MKSSLKEKLFLITFAAIVLLVVLNIDAIYGLLLVVLGAMNPHFVGGLLAFVLNVPMKKLEDLIEKVPFLEKKKRLLAMNQPSTKSHVSANSVNAGKAPQRIGVGLVGAVAVSVLCSETGLNADCATDGRMRYSHERRLCTRGAVNAVPLNCSAYKSWAQR